MRLIDADKVDFNGVFIGASDFARDTKNAAQSLIDSQPEIGEWIPVEERLPEETGDYWVTVKHLDSSLATEKMFWCNNSYVHAEAWKKVVVAWQPYYYPEPFVPQN